MVHCVIRLGVIVTLVAVVVQLTIAMLLAYPGLPVERVAMGAASTDKGWWTVTVHQGPGRLRVYSSVSKIITSGRGDMMTPPAYADPWDILPEGLGVQPGDYAFTFAYGWPWHCLMCSIDPATSRSEVQGGIALNDDLYFPSDTNLPSVLPARIVWPGLLANLAAYGIVCLTLLVTVQTIRRLWNRTRRRCPECSYDLRGLSSEGCPECGWKREKNKP